MQKSELLAAIQEEIHRHDFSHFVDVPAISPHKWQREQHVAWMEGEFLPFFQWCYARYTKPQLGAARLVAVPEEERKQLKVMLNGWRFVSTCSFRSVRERDAAKAGDAAG